MTISRIGLVGLGYISTYHGDGARLAAPGAELLGLDLDPVLRQQAMGRGLVDRAVGDLDELIAARPEVVHVLTPPDTHASVAVPLLSAGIDVLLEKPLAHTPESAADIAAAAAASGASVGVSHNLLYYAAWERARTLIADGAIGSIRSVETVARRPLGFLRVDDVRPWMMRASTNVLFEVAPHAFAHVLDVVPSVNVEAVRTGSPQLLPNGVTFHRQWDIIGSAGEVAVRVALAYEDAMAELTIAVRGTLGSILVDIDLATMRLVRRGFAGFDVELLQQSTGTAGAFVAGAARRLKNVVASKAGSRRHAEPFTESIRASVASFYAGRTTQVDVRQEIGFGAAVVDLAEQVAVRSGADREAPNRPVAAVATKETPAPAEVVETPRVLVIGGTGFIGTHLVRALAAQGPVRLVARSPRRAAEQFAGLPVEVVPGDVRDTESILRHVDDQMVVYHLAFGGGATWDELRASDLDPGIALADALAERNIARYVYTSTIAIYNAGKRRRTITEQTPASRGTMRVAPYSRSKALMEEHLGRLHRTRGLPVVIARPGVVLGVESDPCHWGVAAWTHSNVCVHWGSGNNPLPIVLVEDVAAAMAAMATAPGIEGESFNLCAPPSITARDYVDGIGAVTGSPVRQRRRPAPQMYAASVAKWAMKLPGRSRVPFPSYSDCAGRSFASTFDCSKAERLLGWQPERRREELMQRAVLDPAKAWTR